MSQVSFETLFPEARTGTISLARGEMLFHKGEEADHIFTVAQGVVRLVRYSIEGKAVSMHTALSGDSFAEASLFSPIYHCDAEAVQSSTVTAYAKGAILDVLHRNGEKNMALSHCCPGRSGNSAPSSKSAPFAPPEKRFCTISCCRPTPRPWKSLAPAQ